MIRTMPHLATLGENMAQNPGAEGLPVKAYDWTAQTSITIARDTAEFHSGSASVRCTTTATTIAVLRCLQYRVRGSGNVQAGCWVKGPAGVNIRIGLYTIYQASSNNYNRLTYAMTGSWQYITSSARIGIPKPEMHCAVVDTDVPYPEIGTVFWVDDIFVGPVP